MQRKHAVLLTGLLLLLPLAWIPVSAATGTGWKVIAWNNLGMHCMDADFSVFSILPPYNTIQAHVIDSSGKLVKDPSRARLSYQAVADPTGSINRTSKGKSNFWAFAAPLFGTALAPDAGLTGLKMPGSGNTAQPMSWDAPRNGYIAEGIPITPFDDQGRKNEYPMMKVTAKDRSGKVLASTNIVLPVSDEMDCSACHSPESGLAARPFGGWVHDPNPQREFRLNILRLHDDHELGNPAYAAALTATGYGAAGLFASALSGKPVLCAACHASEALAAGGQPGAPPLTQAMHAGHAHVEDPLTGLSLDASTNRSSCYRCHPGSETRCLRGAMGNATAADGSMLMQCQGCHGGMSVVGASDRTGWLDEPTCQQCHSGTATRNSGQIRFASVFDSHGTPRLASDPRFATNADTPAPGLSLYRFSRGHGGLQCSACHGSTHAEYPSSHPNDNLQSLALQGHTGTLAECSACHGSKVPSGTNGPHGLHPVGQSWVGAHGDVAEKGVAACRACHGADDRGTVLSRTFAARTFRAEGKTKVYAAGAAVGCYDCHDGASGEDGGEKRADPPFVARFHGPIHGRAGRRRRSASPGLTGTPAVVGFVSVPKEDR